MPDLTEKEVADTFAAITQTLDVDWLAVGAVTTDPEPVPDVEEEEAKPPAVDVQTGTVAQGDILLIPAPVLARYRETWFTGPPQMLRPGGQSLLPIPEGGNAHVLTGEGVTYVVARPGRGEPSGIFAAIRVPVGGTATLTHMGSTAHHAPVTLGTGEWVVSRQREPITTPPAADKGRSWREAARQRKAAMPRGAASLAADRRNYWGPATD
jgi:hypothetical protein